MRPRSLWILLIDDKRGMMARQSVLAQQGHKVVVASGVEEGLKQLTSQTFDVLLIDYRMLESSRQRVIQKSREQNPQIAIVVLSGYVETLGLTEQSTGADIVLSKGPHEVQDLLRATGRLSRRIPAKPPGSLRGRSTGAKPKTG